VVSGLQVQGTLGAANLQVQAGIAIDRRGNLIVLSTGGSGVLGDAPPLTETPVPVTVPTAGLISQKYLLTIQWKETHRQIASPSDFFCGKEEQTPQLRLQPVTGFTDSDDYVCLAVVELDTGGVVKSVNVQDSAAPLGRRRLGETVGAVRFEASMNSNPAGTVQEMPAAALEPLPAGNGLQITAALTALTGKLCLAPTSATLPYDLPGSTVVLSNTQGGGGGVKTLDVNGKVMAAFTTSGTGSQQAGYVTVGTAAGTEIVSLGASATGTGQVQVQTRAGKPAVVLNTVGAADDGIVHVLSNNQDVVTLGPEGISSKGNISTLGSLSSQGGVTTVGAITAQGNLMAGNVASQGTVTAQGSMIAQGSITAHGSITAASIASQGGISAQGPVSCTFVSGQGWSASNGAISGNGWSHGAGGVSGQGWSLGAGGVFGQGWSFQRGWASFQNGNNKNVVTLATTAGSADGFFETEANAGFPLIRLSTVGAGNASLALFNPASKPVVQFWVGAGGAGTLAVRDGNGTTKLWMDGSNGSKNFVLPHPNDPQRQIVYTCLEGPEAAAYCRGRASLTEGLAEVSFPEHFALVVNGSAVTIQVTPRSADSKGLAVVGQSDSGFRVRELLAGAGTYEFDYFATGIRKGFEEYQAVVPKDISPLGQPMMGEPAPAGPEAVSAVKSPPAAPATEPAAPAPAPAPQGEKPDPWSLL
jgi:hypothetical protein